MRENVVDEASWMYLGSGVEQYGARKYSQYSRMLPQSGVDVLQAVLFYGDVQASRVSFETFRLESILL